MVNGSQLPIGTETRYEGFQSALQLRDATDREVVLLEAVGYFAQVGTQEQITTVVKMPGGMMTLPLFAF